MVKRNIPILVILLAFACFAGYWRYKQRPFTLTSLKDRQHVQMIVGEKRITTEVVVEPDSITQGLSGRTEIGSDGMLFVLPSVLVPTFWMKEMQLNLDFVWIRNNQVIEITRNVSKPLPEQTDDKLPQYQPHTEVDMVLEILAGKADEWGIKPGDSIMISCTSTPRKWYDVLRFYDCPN